MPLANPDPQPACRKEIRIRSAFPFWNRPPKKNKKCLRAKGNTIHCTFIVTRAARTSAQELHQLVLAPRLNSVLRSTGPNPSRGIDSAPRVFVYDFTRPVDQVGNRDISCGPGRHRSDSVAYWANQDHRVAPGKNQRTAKGQEPILQPRAAPAFDLYVRRGFSLPHAGPDESEPGNFSVHSSKLARCCGGKQCDLSGRESLFQVACGSRIWRRPQEFEQKL